MRPLDLADRVTAKLHGRMRRVGAVSRAIVHSGRTKPGARLLRKSSRVSACSWSIRGPQTILLLRATLLVVCLASVSACAESGVPLGVSGVQSDECHLDPGAAELSVMPWYVTRRLPPAREEVDALTDKAIRRATQSAVTSEEWSSVTAQVMAEFGEDALDDEELYTPAAENRARELEEQLLQERMKPQLAHREAMRRMLSAAESEEGDLDFPLQEQLHLWDPEIVASDETVVQIGPNSRRGFTLVDVLEAAEEFPPLARLFRELHSREIPYVFGFANRQWSSGRLNMFGDAEDWDGYVQLTPHSLRRRTHETPAWVAVIHDDLPPAASLHVVGHELLHVLLIGTAEATEDASDERLEALFVYLNGALANALPGEESGVLAEHEVTELAVKMRMLLAEMMAFAMTKSLVEYSLQKAGENRPLAQMPEQWAEFPEALQEVFRKLELSEDTAQYYVLLAKATTPTEFTARIDDSYWSGSTALEKQILVDALKAFFAEHGWSTDVESEAFWNATSQP